MRLSVPRHDVSVLMTEELQIAHHRLTNALDIPGVQVWTGPSRAGKTEAAKLFVKLAENDHDGADPDSARAAYLSVVESTRRGKKPLWVSILRAVERPIGARLARTSDDEDLLTRLVMVLRTERVLVLFIDEAGALSDAGLRGVADLHDHAHRSGWPLKTILIGMDELPERVRSQPQLNGRCESWVFFSGLKKKEVACLLADHIPEFLKGLDPQEEAVLVDELAKFTRGRPGDLMKFVLRLRASRKAMAQRTLKIALGVLHKVQQDEQMCFSEKFRDERLGL